ncbi:hypothetical protein P4493_05990 [Bacillus thuringiensis]|jgi:hypothetical protein|uniref:Uncharacterized protein n=3 Tax=Bacillus thuringiensis TaxID=1428 RepID=A0A0B5N8S2_BACTU|nr:MULTISPECIES: hypothetical protein [Bacillus]EAO55619.1 hypothetical protein RBTH_06755 [Bacillus thuringiensis serovar israelensis ATCC 35646]MEC2533114.1 hypothetical protein [Bacillus cereus]MED1153906.1 hypothetical protein [Bacillus paranthracis]OUB09250.1 hypothetical protein BK708_32465 [Bacillus thuringiensis serovar yunnanensis]AFQ30214.1 hypothetical protein BTF1_30567 [Bacillus thuringiensis HD-789]
MLKENRIKVTIVEKPYYGEHPYACQTYYSDGSRAFVFHSKNELLRWCNYFDVKLTRFTEYPTLVNGLKIVYIGNKELKRVIVNSFKEVPSGLEKVRGAVGVYANEFIDLYVENTNECLTFYEVDYANPDIGKFRLGGRTKTEDGHTLITTGWLELPVCYDCNKPSVEKQDSSETPKDMFRCDGVFHREDKLIHKKCTNWYKEKRYCKECYNGLMNLTELEVEHEFKLKMNMTEYTFFTKNYNAFEEDQTYYHLTRKFLGERTWDKIENWLDLFEEVTDVYKEEKAKTKEFAIVTFEDIEEVPISIRYNKCYAIDRGNESIFYCYIMNSKGKTIIFKPTNIDDLYSLGIVRTRLQEFQKVRYLGEFK